MNTEGLKRDLQAVLGALKETRKPAERSILKHWRDLISKALSQEAGKE